MATHIVEKPSERLVKRKAGGMILILISILIACIIILLRILQAWSYPGKPKQYLDENGNPLPNSISEKVFVNINGIQQGMFIKSKDIHHPVLLYLHGGMPDYFLTQKYPTGLEDEFTVVWWEQRGSALSYSDSFPRETMNKEQLISDTLEVTNYLRHRFGKEKIYLMGHSGGSFIGMEAAAQAAELYNAYIGVAQMSNQLASEKLAYDYMLEQFKANGNLKMARRLEATTVTMTGGVPASYEMRRDVAMHSLGIGTMHKMRSLLSGLILPSFQCRDYTLGEKINLWRAKSRSGISSVWDDMTVTDLTKQVTKLEIPVYFFHGIYDYTVNYSLAKDYFEHIQAPVKGFYTFEHSAHSPMFEEPEKMQKIIREDILQGTNTLADPAQETSLIQAK